MAAKAIHVEHFNAVKPIDGIQKIRNIRPIGW